MIGLVKYAEGLEYSLTINGYTTGKSIGIARSVCGGVAVFLRLHTEGSRARAVG